MEAERALAGDPLAGLQEIALSDPVAYVPMTVGWVIAGCVLLLALAWIAWTVVRHRRANAYRREALAELVQIEAALGPAQPVQATAAAAALPALLKRTAMAATSREQVASLTGRAWLRFLDRTLGGDAFTHGAGQLLTGLAYDESALARISRDDLDQLLRLSRRWIEKHEADRG